MLGTSNPVGKFDSYSLLRWRRSIQGYIDESNIKPTCDLLVKHMTYDAKRTMLIEESERLRRSTGKIAQDAKLALQAIQGADGENYNEMSELLALYSNFVSADAALESILQMVEKLN
jgi:hypothetical protein